MSSSPARAVCPMVILLAVRTFGPPLTLTLVSRPIAIAPIVAALALEPIAIVSVLVAVAPLIATELVPVAVALLIATALLLPAVICPRHAVTAYELPAPKRAAEITVNLKTVAIPFLPDLADTSVLFCSADDFTRPLANSDVTTKD